VPEGAWQVVATVGGALDWHLPGLSALIAEARA
jgi:hypothetical protein